MSATLRKLVELYEKSRSFPDTEGVEQLARMLLAFSERLIRLTLPGDFRQAIMFVAVSDFKKILEFSSRF